MLNNVILDIVVKGSIDCTSTVRFRVGTKVSDSGKVSNLYGSFRLAGAVKPSEVKDVLRGKIKATGLPAGKGLPDKLNISMPKAGQGDVIEVSIKPVYSPAAFADVLDQVEAFWNKSEKAREADLKALTAQMDAHDAKSEPAPAPAETVELPKPEEVKKPKPAKVS